MHSPKQWSLVSFHVIFNLFRLCPCDKMWQNRNNIRWLSLVRPFTASGGVIGRAWFDMYKTTPFVPEHTQTLEDGCKTLRALIEQEELEGIPRSRIVLGKDSTTAACSSGRVVTEIWNIKFECSCSVYSPPCRGQIRNQCSGNGRTFPT